MRMEQNLTHTDYALWEVIVNGDAPAVIASVSGSAEADVSPKTTVENIARRNELKAKSTILLAILDEHLLKFHGIKDAKTLWEAIKISSQGQTFALTYVDDVMFSFFANQSNSLQLDNEDLEQIDTDDLEEMDLKWQTKVECYNCHRRSHFAKECKAPRSQGTRNRDNTRRVVPVETPTNALVVTDGMGSSSSDTKVNTCSKECLKSYQTLQKESRIIVHQKNEAVFKEDIAFLKYDVKVRDISISELKNKLEESLNKDDLKLKLEKFKTSSRNLTNFLNSQLSSKDKTGLSYDSPLNERDLSNKSNVFESASDSSVNESEDDNNQANGRYKAGLDDFVFKSAISETVTSVNETETSTSKTSKETVITNSGKVPVIVAKQSSPGVAASTSTARYVNTAANRPIVNGSPKGGKISRKGKIRTGKLDFDDVYSVKELKFNIFPVSQICDKKNSILFTKTGYLVLSPDFKLPDENQVLLKVPRQNNMYSFDLKNVVPLGGLTCLFAKDNRVLVTKPHNKTPYELLISRSPNIEFKKPFRCPVTILNTLDHLGKFDGKANEGFLVGYSVNSKAFRSLQEIKLDADIEINAIAGKVGQEKSFNHEYILLPFLPLSTQSSDDKDAGDVPDKGDEGISKGSDIEDQENTNSSTQDVSTAEPSINTAITNINTGSLNINTVGSNDPSMPSLEETSIFDDVYDDIEVGADADTNKLELSTVDERGIVFRNKARLVAQGYTQEEGIDYDEVFAPDVRIEAIKIFLAYASFMGFIVYQIDVKSVFPYGIREEEVYVCQPLVFEDPHFLNKVYKKDDRIFISQDNYVADILKKFDFTTLKTTSTPMEPNKILIKDVEAKDVDVHLYRSMIGSLMYLIASRPNIMFAVCACARFQVTPKNIHLYDIKRIFRYLKGQPKLGLWYPRDSPFDLEGISDSDYAGASLDRKSTTGDGKKVVVNEASIRCDLRLDDAEGTIFLPNAAIFEELARMGKQRKETVVSYDEPPTEEHIPTPSYDPLPSGEDRLQLNELIEIYTKLSDMVLSLEQTKTNQATKIKKLKKRVKKHEGKKKKRTHGLKRLYKIGLSTRIVASDDEGLDQGRINDQDLFGVHDLDGDEVFVDVTTGENVEHDETVAKKAQTLMEIKAAKPKEKGVTIQEPSEFRTTSFLQPPQAKYNGKGITVEPKKPLKKKDHNALDEKVTIKLEAEMKVEMDKEKRIAREKNEVNIAVQAKVADDDTTKLKRCLEIVPEDDDDVTIKATNLSSKSPTIVDYKIYKEGKKSYFKIIRADENSQNYLTFGIMFKNFNREDLEVLRSIVKESASEEFPMAEQFPTANEDKLPLLSQSDATAKELCVAAEEVIEFRDSYVAPKEGAATDSAGEGTAAKKGRTIAITTEDMQKRMNDVKKKSESNSQNMAFISSAKNSSGKEEVNTASIPTASTNVSPGSANIGASALTAIRWATLQGSAGLPGAKTGEGETTTDKEEYHALVADEEAPTEFSLMAKTSADSEVEGRLVEFKNQEIKFCEKIRCLEFSVECKTNKIENLTNELKTLKKEKEGLESKLTCFKSASKDLDNLLESQRSDKNKEGLGYSVVPLPPAQVYSPPKKDMSWTGLLEFADDIITDYTRPSPSVESNPDDLQNNSSSASEKGESTGSILSKPEIKFVNHIDNSTVVKTDKKETVRKLTVKYAELYRKTSQRSNSNSQINIDDKGYWDIGCSRHMTSNISYLSDYEPYDGGYVSFGQGGCKITGKGTIKTRKLKFTNVYFVKDLKYNMFSVSQI
nr:hypothetical protein [Tanacetum cinerariifolium]